MIFKIKFDNAYNVIKNSSNMIDNRDINLVCITKKL